MPLPPAIQRSLVSLIDSLINLESPGSAEVPRRFYSFLFRDLPDKNLYPDYYYFIKEPRCLNGILDSIQKGIYSSPQAVAYELFLVWQNARQYNQMGSIVYNDSEKLEAYMQKLWTERSPPLPPFNSLPRPGSLPDQQPIVPSRVAPIASTSTLPHPEEPKTKRIKLKITQPAIPSTPVSSLPKVSIKPLIPPSSTGTPTLKLKLGAPPSTPKHTLTLNPPAERSHRSERDRKPIVEPLGAGVLDDVETGWMSGDFGDFPNMHYTLILEQIKNYSLEGRLLSAIIQKVPDRETRPDYYQAIGTLAPISLEMIEEKIATSQYTTPESFDRDLAHLFLASKRAALNGNVFPEAPTVHGRDYSDLCILQILYQVLTKPSPPTFGLNPSLGILASIPSGPLNLLALKNPDEAPAGNFMDQSKVISTPRVNLKDRFFLNQIRLKGVVYSPGDWVYLINPDEAGKPIIGQIFKIYKKSDSRQRYVSVCWYFRPEDTYHLPSHQFYEHEVFKTSNFVDHMVEDILSPILVLYITRYVRSRPPPPTYSPETPLYIVESRYKPADPTTGEGPMFKKIKNWTSCVPEEARANGGIGASAPGINDWIALPGAPIIINRVFSPFLANGTAGGVGSSIKGAGGLMNPPMKREKKRKDVSGNGVPIFVPATPAGSTRINTPQGSGPPNPIASSVSLGIADGPVGAFPRLSLGVSRMPVVTNASFNLDSSVNGVAHTPRSDAAERNEEKPQVPLDDMFAKIPSELKEKFHTQKSGELVWYPVPPRFVQVVEQPKHSEAWKEWRRERGLAT